MVGFQQSLRCFLLLAAVLAGINIISHAMIFIIRRLQHALAVLQFF
jgi:hypothetical protein